MAKFSKVEHIEGNRIDPETGEVLDILSGTKITQILKNVPEEKFVKIYYDTFLASLGSNESVYSSLLLEIGKRMTWSDDGQVVYLIKSAKESIARSLNISLGRVNNLLSELIKLGLLIRIGRATYAVSPFVMAKGEWDKVLALQLNYNAQLREIEVSQPDRIKAPRPKHLATVEAMGVPAIPDSHDYPNEEDNEHE